jgi:hypothetical protein
MDAGWSIVLASFCIRASQSELLFTEWPVHEHLVCPAVLSKACTCLQLCVVHNDLPAAMISAVLLMRHSCMFRLLIRALNKRGLFPKLVRLEETDFASSVFCIIWEINILS